MPGGAPSDGCLCAPGAAVAGGVDRDERRGAPDPRLPPVEEWKLVMCHHHRTREALDSSAQVVLRFAAAQYAVLAARGQDTAHLLRVDGSNKVRSLESFMRPVPVSCGPSTRSRCVVS